MIGIFGSSHALSPVVFPNLSFHFLFPTLKCFRKTGGFKMDLFGQYYFCIGGQS